MAIASAAFTFRVFNYEVNDNHSGNHFGHNQTADGDNNVGSYFVHLPDGRLQKVTYVENYLTGEVIENQVEYEGKAQFYFPDENADSHLHPSYNSPPNYQPPHSY